MFASSPNDSHTAGITGMPAPLLLGQQRTDRVQMLEPEAQDTGGCQPRPRMFYQGASYCLSSLSTGEHTVNTKSGPSITLPPAPKEISARTECGAETTPAKPADLSFPLRERRFRLISSCQPLFPCNSSNQLHEIAAGTWR